jgi:hypothetical protein
MEFFIDINSSDRTVVLAVDSASNRNEYREYFQGGKCGRCVRLTTLPTSYAVVKKSGNLRTLTSWNPLGHPRPVTVLLYLYLYLYKKVSTDFNFSLIVSILNNMG